MIRLVCSCFVAGLMLLLTPSMAWGQIHQHENETGTRMVRSLESLRDLDYDSWQAVAYREGPPGQPVVLRIVGYPGKVARSPNGCCAVARRERQSTDITLDNPALASDGREAPQLLPIPARRSQQQQAASRSACLRNCLSLPSLLANGGLCRSCR